MKLEVKVTPPTPEAALYTITLSGLTEREVEALTHLRLCAKIENQCSREGELRQLSEILTSASDKMQMAHFT